MNINRVSWHLTAYHVSQGLKLQPRQPQRLHQPLLMVLIHTDILKHWWYWSTTRQVVYLLHTLYMHTTCWTRQEWRRPKAVGRSKAFRGGGVQRGVHVRCEAHVAVVGINTIHLQVLLWLSVLPPRVNSPVHDTSAPFFVLSPPPKVYGFSSVHILWLERP